MRNQQTESPIVAVGYVYRIWSVLTNKCYIGSTMNRHPNHRFTRHKNSYKTGENGCTVNQIFDEVGPENCAVSVLETHEDVTEEFVLRREQHLIEMHPNAVNKNRAIKPAKVGITRRSPEPYIARMFYQNGDEDVSVPLSMVNPHRYYKRHQRDKQLAKQKAQSNFCDDCQAWYNQIKVHYISEKHKKRVAQLVLSPIAAKYNDTA